MDSQTCCQSSCSTNTVECRASLWRWRTRSWIEWSARPKLIYLEIEQLKQRNELLVKALKAPGTPIRHHEGLGEDAQVQVGDKLRFVGDEPPNSNELHTFSPMYVISQWHKYAYKYAMTSYGRRIPRTCAEVTSLGQLDHSYPRPQRCTLRISLVDPHNIHSMFSLEFVVDALTLEKYFVYA